MFDTKPFDEKMTKSVGAFERELDSIRAGRANPRVLDRLTADYYGTATPIAQMATISVPEPRILQISPYDASAIKEIEKAIAASDLGINPGNDGKVIRLVFPELTEERRKDLGKDIKKKGDDAKVSIRNIRREAIDAAEKEEKASTITEDQLKKAKDDIQKLTDKRVEDIDKHVEAKTKEIMTV